jgi:hypothetical protein
MIAITTSSSTSENPPDRERIRGEAAAEILVFMGISEQPYS